MKFTVYSRYPANEHWSSGSSFKPAQVPTNVSQSGDQRTRPASHLNGELANPSETADKHSTE